MADYRGSTKGQLVYTQETRSQWNPAMENGIGGLVNRFSRLGVDDSSMEHLVQIMKAVQAAEDTIKQQVEENNRLRNELQKRDQELEKYKPDDSTVIGPHSERGKHIHGPYRACQSFTSEMSQEESQHYSEGSKVNGNLKALPRGQAAVDNAGFSQFSQLDSRSFSPSRYQREGEFDTEYGSAGRGLMSNNSNSVWKQDLILKVREHEEEILQLRKHLSEYSIKEAEIHKEKNILEKRIAYMRLAFDQQQQDLVDAASKAISYRQDIIEENIRLTYALQAAQQEKSTFVSSLLPLLAEYSLQPSVPDAQAIVSNLKVLFKHLQEKLVVTEKKNGLELVPQPTYSYGQALVSSPSNAQITTDWDPLAHHIHPSTSGGATTKSMDPDKLVRSSPSTSRNSAILDAAVQFTAAHGDSQSTRFSEATTHFVSSNEMVDSDAVRHQNERETSAHWGSGNSAYLTPTLDDPNSSFSPYLPAVLEEPSSSFSEAADDDPLPAVEGLQISGDAFPGRKLQACGYSINGTTSCNFEWIRHMEDGSVNYIEGAKKPTYLVTADDVDCYLAIEVQPLDDRKRKGEIVKVFANEQRKITGDSEMKNQVEKTLYSGHASYEVILLFEHHDVWEPAILALKKEGFSIKCKGNRSGVFTEKFLQSTLVTIPVEHATAFSILGSGGTEYVLQTNDDSSSLRDTIVYIMRLFIKRAGEKRKGRKKVLFFNN
ncbi:PREDICTED: uncharacterized protein LOC104593212 isoform X2 [Nelumbo nucifera]|uniref:Uncharacterized protein LOC104593212 isoform X2 n=1 Tax=Nelumbo nucifera TaxID=4432 RepID=A0A1U7ZID9_NELNU|nr:PREDICTED: uncharacterized protein LOC104593212 isoform X2 [Nelumbo nucifera]